MEEITSECLYTIFKENKQSRFKTEPDFDKVLNEVSLKLDVPASEILLTDIKTAFNEYKEAQKSNRSLNSEFRVIEKKTILLRSKYLLKEKKKSPLQSVGDRQQRRRMSEFMSLSKDIAKEENTSPTKLFAFGLKAKYLHDKEIAQVGQAILQDEKLLDRHISLEAAAAIFESGKMTKRIYTDVRLILKTAGADVLPPYKMLLNFKMQRRPTVEKLVSPFSGVKFDYLSCLDLTSSQLFSSLDLPILNTLKEVHLNIHDGLDGSGGHSIFNQIGSTETNNIIMYMFRIENLKTANGNILWENSAHASSSSCRPVMLLMGKESRDNCEIVTSIQSERQGAQFTVNHNKNLIDVHVHAKMSMVDGKMHTALSGLGGAYCCLCTHSKGQCHDSDYVDSGFKVN